MRRAALLVLILICVWFVGCSSFVTQSRQDFFSHDKGVDITNYDADKPAETKAETK